MDFTGTLPFMIILVVKGCAHPVSGHASDHGKSKLK
jgi:hypothetical protein